jgi:hypothetical protein
VWDPPAVVQRERPAGRYQGSAAPDNDPPAVVQRERPAGRYQGSAALPGL